MAQMDDVLPELLTLPSGIARVEWRRSSRARRVSLRIDAAGGGVIVVLPPRASTKLGDGAVEEYAGAGLRTDLAALPEAVQFTLGAVVPIGGVPHRIRHVTRGRGAAWLADNQLHVTGAPEFLSRRVRDFLRQEARRRLTALTIAKASLIGIAPRRVTMKDTSSRWGSCAPDKSIALSWRLVMAPDFPCRITWLHTR